MMDDRTFDELVREIELQGIDRETARRYAVIIGDTPVTDDDGNLLVLDDDSQVIATLKPLPFYG